MRLSVALAAYHGEEYIEPQLLSILEQLGTEDEVIVSDDAPGGETQRIVERLAECDKRVRYLKGNGGGVIKNFENALSNALGDVIFLSDQDDVWLPGKVEAVLKEIDLGADLVLHDTKLTDAELNVTEESFFKVNGSKKGFKENFIHNSYMGCCMAFTREICEMSLPFPEDIPMHDQWIGMLAERFGRVTFIEKPYLLHRCHGGNVTGGKTSLKDKILWRVKLAVRLKERINELQTMFHM